MTTQIPRPNGHTHSLTTKNCGSLTYLDSLTPRSRAQGIEELKIQNNLAQPCIRPSRIASAYIVLIAPLPFLYIFEYGARDGDLGLRFRRLVR